MLKFRKGEKFFFFFFFFLFFFWKAGKEGCDLGKGTQRSTDTVLRQIEFRVEDTWKDLENDFIETACDAQGPRKVFV